jgi:pyruvate dehydrogenase E2 component (dihydrolipoamide acetyltransferase)
MGENFLKTLIVLVLVVGLIAQRTGFHKRIPAIAAFLAKRSREKLSGFEPRQAQVGGDTLQWLEGGNPKHPGIVLVHPFGVDKQVWLATGARLREAGYRVVALDLISGNESRKLDVTAMARRLRAVISSANLIRPHLVGAGLGGTISATLACAAPQELASLTLIEPLGFGSPYASDLDRLLEKGRNPLVPTEAAHLDVFLRLLMARPEVLSETERKRLCDLAIAQAPARSRLWEGCLGAEKARILDQLLPELRIKTTVIWGARSRVAPPENAEAIRAIVANARLTSIRDAGHLVMVDQPEVAAQAILEAVA